MRVKEVSCDDRNGRRASSILQKQKIWRETVERNESDNIQDVFRTLFFFCQKKKHIFDQAKPLFCCKVPVTASSDCRPVFFFSFYMIKQVFSEGKTCNDCCQKYNVLEYI